MSAAVYIYTYGDKHNTAAQDWHPVNYFRGRRKSVRGKRDLFVVIIFFLFISPSRPRRPTDNSYRNMLPTIYTHKHTQTACISTCAQLGDMSVILITRDDTRSRTSPDLRPSAVRRSSFVGRWRRVVVIILLRSEITIGSEFDRNVQRGRGGGSDLVVDDLLETLKNRVKWPNFSNNRVQ